MRRHHVSSSPPVVRVAATLRRSAGGVVEHVCAVGTPVRRRRLPPPRHDGGVGTWPRGARRAAARPKRTTGRDRPARGQAGRWWDRRTHGHAAG
ncbi:hypothetical protein DVS28_a2912 [Euzebya pacifica]|uniref:Uncharacterized protein n=1 Tax=Euzebya pacifica TaxID=1608957 RepID=A0A346XZE4_9ACTN|nr:hypothetical protein DVS28_a2912 [Euzebya pacifica]